MPPKPVVPPKPAVPHAVGVCLFVHPMMRHALGGCLGHAVWIRGAGLFGTNRQGLSPQRCPIFLSMANNPLLQPRTVAALRQLVPAVAHRATEALVVEIPEFGPTIRSPRELAQIERAIRLALRGALGLTEQPGNLEAAAPRQSTLEAAYSLGQYEARRGRTMDALLAAYRVGARVSWRDLSAELVRRPVPAATVARVAELVFAYIDRLSAASIAGHADELASAGRAREQRLERLAVALLSGAPAVELQRLADGAAWAPPELLAAVVVGEAHARPMLQRLDHRTLMVPGDLASGVPEQRCVLLVPVLDDSRRSLAQTLQGTGCVIGPTRGWSDVAASYRRALRAAEALPAPKGEPLDTEQHLVEPILDADPEALGDLRRRVLAPLGALRPATADRLAETLRAWLLHQGRREEVAAELHLHPQTIRYRMTRLRELYGELLRTPEGVLELVVALATIAPEHGTTG